VFIFGAQLRRGHLLRAIVDAVGSGATGAASTSR
jgi:hypothetical protein